ncbi:uncharacterized protein si:dkeyp-117h8.4 isoform X1 [Sander lucioperca]|uniref:uncharacterized protein si:dkeyp-117h8.4 isoform X1 n=2 Tax=Sander lucioperca TaxID=283035 RepID=UPI00125E14FE|nr:uncharacterized protein si:dkeyp-117h8.4 isoform X1 [Sander lucioperca]
MDDVLQTRLVENSRNYRNSLERIIDKYSKLQYQDGGVEVDLDSTRTQTLEHYMNLSKVELNKLDSKSLTDLREESIGAQDITRDSQLDFTHQDGEAEKTCVSTTQLSVQDDWLASNDTTHQTVSSMDESRRTISETEVQPEEQDDDLETSLRSQGSSLVELYPSMISRIGRAWHRQHVSEAADSVLRRYRRWRQQSNRSNLSKTFVVTLRHTNRNQKNRTSQTPLKENTNSPAKRQFVGTQTAPQSPLQNVTNMQDWQAQQQSPGRVRREQHKPILAMDLSGPAEFFTSNESSLNETFMPKESSLNETFTVCEVSRLGEQPSINKFSPSRPCYPAAKASLDPSLGSKRLSFTAHSLQTVGCSTCASEATAARERPDIYGSPVRQSPSQARVTTSLSSSPHAFSRSPKAHSVESFSREPTRPRLMSTPPQKPTMPQRMLHPQDPHHSLHPQLRSPQVAMGTKGRDRLRRHLSFDSSLPSIRISCSPKKLDEDFLKLYHKFVCQNKSSVFNRLPCRLCAQSSEAGRSPSSSALAALALSPHRSLLRKRHRELDWDSHPQSKRLRDEYCPSSPGSYRHGKEMLRRRLSQSEYEQSHYGLSYSSTKPSMSQRFSPQKRSADTHQETWMSRHRHVSAANFSGMGSSLENRMAHGFSPRKW